jgi:hypothetical protein
VPTISVPSPQRSNLERPEFPVAAGQKTFCPAAASFETFQKVFKTYDYARKTTLMVFFRNYLSFRNFNSLQFFNSFKDRNSRSFFLSPFLVY